MIYADLVTLAQVQAALPDLGAAQLADAPAVITAVSQHISARYRRGMAALTVQEEVEIGMNRAIRFNWRPVLQVLKVEADQVPFLRILNAGPATEAMVTLNVTGEADALVSSGVTLTSTTAGIVAAPIALAWTNYPTVQQLVDQINTLGNDWSAEVQGSLSDQANLGLMPTAGIMPDQGGRSALRLGAQLWGYSRALNDWTLGRNELVLFEWRAAGYQFPDRQWGADNRTTRFRVTYRAGCNAVPADVQRATILTIRDVLDRTAHEGGVTSLRSEDYSLVLDTMGGIPSAAKALLSRYQDRGL